MKTRSSSGRQFGAETFLNDVLREQTKKKKKKKEKKKNFEQSC
jgi:hypothetical protein